MAFFLDLVSSSFKLHSALALVILRLHVGVTPAACCFASRLIELGAAKMLAVCCASLATKASLLDKGCLTVSGVSLGTVTPTDWSSCKFIVADD
jgi:hypothetical protein